MDAAGDFYLFKSSTPGQITKVNISSLVRNRRKSKLMQAGECVELILIGPEHFGHLL